MSNVLTESPFQIPVSMSHNTVLRAGTVVANSKWPPPVTARALCEQPLETPSMLIEGVLYQGGTMLLSGPSKAHKTYTMMDAACSISLGQPWLGIETIQCPVIYINFELQDFAARDRISAITRAKKIWPAPEQLLLWNLRNQPVTLDILSAELPPIIKKLGAGLVVIDPHYKLSSLSGCEENSNDQQGALLSRLEALTGANGAAIMVAHHFAKGNASGKNQIDRASGGGVFARWPDVFMTLSEHTEEGAMSVEFALRNFAPIAPFAVRWEHPLWGRDAKLDPKKLKRTGAPEAFPATDALKILGEACMTNTEWFKATGWAESTFRRKRDDLVDAGRVVKKDGTYRKVPL